MAELVVLRAGEGEIVTDTPKRTLRILTDHELLNLTWFRYETGEEGPDPHVHYTHSDAFYVLEGEIELRLGPEVESFPARAGTLGAAPPNLVHTFRNSSDATALFINVHAPGAGFADMMRARRDGRHRDADRFDQHEPPADGGRPLSDSVLTEPGETSAGDTDGNFSLANVQLTPGSSRELAPVTGIFVLEGTIALDGTDLGPGDFALGENGALHTDIGGRCVVIQAPR
jgi:mannose-6-phosphate isomerase-like protein (cupin superfamily)